jgi:hypothetical protein
VLLAFALAIGEAAAAACPEAPPPRPESQPPRAIDFADLLRRPRQPSTRLEHTTVIIEGTLLRIRAVTPRVPAGCRPEAARTWRLWLVPKLPAGARKASRHDAVVAVVASRVVEEQLGGEPGLERLVGARVSVTGRLTFNPSRRGELTRTRGTLWELRGVSAVTPWQAPPPEPAPAQPPSVQPPAPPEPVIPPSGEEDGYGE